MIFTAHLYHHEKFEIQHLANELPFSNFAEYDFLHFDVNGIIKSDLQKNR